ncbi:MarR family transcriptional regulator [Vibrio sp. JPW-9-11-11]|uniref:MarR family winged helix-turn-helix transcriptional regulator n=1 Tax=Vibrio sp. JPW-9-11-11 TaxID=1416532 RepID=UPI0015932E1B|nr:MarR family transcriptional regulator [Vibrio sp. JPW-9-11-11]NVD06898.1 MarR family transcriptional regulator [Vibrio sp. JPW-9-11-11]
MSDCDGREMSAEQQSLLLENQICFPLYSASNAVIRTYRPLLEKLDLTYSQYLVMMVLWECDGVSVKALGQRLHLDSGTLTPLLKRLALKGYVERGRSEQDERVRVLKLTAAGADLKQRALQIPQQMQCQFHLELDELITLKHLCEKVLASIEDEH